jgi:hypothetical protein
MCGLAEERSHNWSVTRPAQMSSSDRREARDAARKGDKVRQRAIANAMRAGWVGNDADESNWLDEAVSAHPGPEAATRALYAIAQLLIGELAEVTGQDRETVLGRVMR